MRSSPPPSRPSGKRTSGNNASPFQNRQSSIGNQSAPSASSGLRTHFPAPPESPKSAENAAAFCCAAGEKRSGLRHTRSDAGENNPGFPEKSRGTGENSSGTGEKCSGAGEKSSARCAKMLRRRALFLRLRSKKLRKPGPELRNPSSEVGYILCFPDKLH